MRDARLELRVERELLERIDSACGDVPRSRWIVRAIEAALEDSTVRTARAVVEADLAAMRVAHVREPVVEEHESKPDPPAGVPLPKIAKRKW
jgi:hypothetical protein